jgi:HsdM N-terminal domain
MKGESLYKISSLMGNSPEIRRRHYAALLPETIIDSVEFAPRSVTGHLQGSVSNAVRLQPRSAYADTLWKAADALRAQVDAAEYKHVVLGLLFLKITTARRHSDLT